jgi:hypothetical protein
LSRDTDLHPNARTSSIFMGKRVWAHRATSMTVPEYDL